jgi:hypothetical protein
MTFVVPIVEGQGEVMCVPRLLWRIANDSTPGARLRVNEPIRVKSGSFFNNASERDRHVMLAAAKARSSAGCILVLLDCDDDCPAQLGPRLRQQVQAVAGGVPVVVALASREYETWFIAAAESLRGVEGFAADAAALANPEAPRNAKGWLGKLLPHGYDPVTHQLPFTSQFDLQAARRVPSFDRLYRKISALLNAEPDPAIA